MATDTDSYLAKPDTIIKLPAQSRKQSPETPMTGVAALLGYPTISRRSQRKKQPFGFSWATASPTQRIWFPPLLPLCKGSGRWEINSGSLRLNSGKSRDKMGEKHHKVNVRQFSPAFQQPGRHPSSTRQQRLSTAQPRLQSRSEMVPPLQTSILGCTDSPSGELLPPSRCPLPSLCCL